MKSPPVVTEILAISADVSRAAATAVIAVQDLESRIALGGKSSRRRDRDVRAVPDQPSGIVERGIQRTRQVDAAVHLERDVATVVDLAVCILNN